MLKTLLFILLPYSSVCLWCSGWTISNEWTILLIPTLTLHIMGTFRNTSGFSPYRTKRQWVNHSFMGQVTHCIPITTNFITAGPENRMLQTGWQALTEFIQHTHTITQTFVWLQWWQKWVYGSITVLWDMLWTENSKWYSVRIWRRHINSTSTPSN